MLASAPSKPGRAANFDRVAGLYRWAEYLCLGPALTRIRNRHLDRVADARQALVLGDGDGRFLAKLLRRSPHLQALAVDSSAAMLQRLRYRCRFAGQRLHIQQLSALELPITEELANTDLIVSHFFLDCLTTEEVEHLARLLAGTVRPGCRWLVSDFAVPAGQPWRALGAVYIHLLYLAFRVLTGLRPQRLPAIERELERAGFRRTVRFQTLAGLLYSELWTLTPLGGHQRHATSLDRQSSTRR